MDRARPALRRLVHRLVPLLASLVAAATGCSYLVFLKPEAIRPLGDRFTERGPAFGVVGETYAAADSAGDWATYNNAYAGTRFSPLGAIDTADVGALQPVCSFPLHERVNFQSGMLAVGGTLYFTTATETFAIDAATCALRWKHTYRFAPGPPFDPNRTNRGVAYLDGRLFRGANDGRVYALDARTGRELWNVVAGDPSIGEIFPAAPIAWRNLVFIGNAGGDDFGVTGHMMAFDAATGGRVWRFDLVPEHGAPNGSWPAATERVPKGGGTTWTSYTLDTTSGTLYVPTGNPGPDFLPEVRPGANLYTTSVVALDARGGELRQHYRVLERDFHDWDVAAAPLLLGTRAGRSLMAVAGKDGHLYAFDRQSGERLFRVPVTTIANVDAPLAAEGTHFCPGVNGGVEWNGPAYSPVTNLLYVGAVDWCTTLEKGNPERVKVQSGLPWTGSKARFEPFGANDASRRGWLTAVDADAGTIVWRYASPTPLIAGVLVTAGGLVFSGDLDGTFFALDAATGVPRFRYATGLPIGGGVISYAVRGRQYIAVAAGMHSPTSWKVRSHDARVLVFALPGAMRRAP